MRDFTAPGTDPDLDDLDAVDDEHGDSERDTIAAELTAAITPTTVIPVTGRPGYTVQFRTDFTGKHIDSLRKKAKDRRFVDGLDGIKFASLLLASTCQGIEREGANLAEALGATGPVTFTTRELQELLSTPNADETVRKFYGLEGTVDATAKRLMAEAGWGDEVEAADPTE